MGTDAECHVGAQAVQWMEERRVEEGDLISLTASHDSYGIQFRVGGWWLWAVPNQQAYK